MKNKEGAEKPKSVREDNGILLSSSASADTGGQNASHSRRVVKQKSVEIPSGRSADLPRPLAAIKEKMEAKNESKALSSKNLQEAVIMLGWDRWFFMWKDLASAWAKAMKEKDDSSDKCFKECVDTMEFLHKELAAKDARIEELEDKYEKGVITLTDSFHEIDGLEKIRSDIEVEIIGTINTPCGHCESEACDKQQADVIEIIDKMFSEIRAWHEGERNKVIVEMNKECLFCEKQKDAEWLAIVKQKDAQHEVDDLTIAALKAENEQLLKACDTKKYAVDVLYLNPETIKGIQSEARALERNAVLDEVEKEVREAKNAYPQDVFKWDNKEALEFNRGRFNKMIYDIVENCREDMLKKLRQLRQEKEKEAKG